MKTLDCLVRCMTRSDLNTALGWAYREGWNPGLYDASPFFQIDPEGGFMAWRDEAPAASIAAWRYGPRYGFIGLYIVPPALRGQGLGMAVWRTAMTRLRGCVVGLDGVMAQQANYERSGFQPAWINTRFEGLARPGGTRHPAIVPLATVPFAFLANYDRAFHPEPRHAFLRAWIARSRSHALGWWDGDALRGYGVLRPCTRGYKFGPLCADSPVIAGALFESLSACVPAGEPIAMDVPEPNAQAMALARHLGLSAAFTTARMYRGPAPSVALHRQYGLTALEIG